jgi:hypothetical protein
VQSQQLSQTVDRARDSANSWLPMRVRAATSTRIGFDSLASPTEVDNASLANQQAEIRSAQGPATKHTQPPELTGTVSHMKR